MRNTHGILWRIIGIIDMIGIGLIPACVYNIPAWSDWFEVAIIVSFLLEILTYIAISDIVTEERVDKKEKSL